VAPRSSVMADTSTPKQLLVVAVQDLHDAERAWIERLPEFAGKTGDAVAAFIEAERERSAAQASRLMEAARALEASPVGSPNIWLRAILDDAARDASTIVAGPLRDIALVGAFRKGKQSERISYETAIGLAEALSIPEAAALLTASRDEEAQADADLAGILAALLQTIS
jgi:ferritin-like metal-binding protein YciE